MQDSPNVENCNKYIVDKKKNKNYNLDQRGNKNEKNKKV